jgi:NADH-quinone oxidoreductase subunit L
MTTPLLVLAACAVLLGFIGTPAWPWFQSYLEGHAPNLSLGNLFRADTLGVMLLSTVIVAGGIGAGWWLYGRRPAVRPDALDPIEQAQPGLFRVLRERFYVDELYDLSVIRANAWWAQTADWFDRVIWNGVVQAVSYLLLGVAWLNRFFDEYVVNLGFDRGCARVRDGGSLLSRFQTGQVQAYLRMIGVGLAVLVLLLTWGCGS